MKYALISENGRKPQKGTNLSAGYDLYSAETKVIKPHKTVKISTDLKIILPSNTYGFVTGRSSLAANHSVIVLPGIIDEDYIGCIYCILHNLSNEDYLIHKSDRIAQLICQKVEKPKLKKVHDINIVTERGCNGFGSTGK